MFKNHYKELGGAFGGGKGVAGLECWYFFNKGFCKWGDDCKYSHVLTGHAAEEPRQDCYGTVAGSNARRRERTYTQWQGLEYPKIYRTIRESNSGDLPYTAERQGFSEQPSGARPYGHLVKGSKDSTIGLNWQNLDSAYPRHMPLRRRSASPHTLKTGEGQQYDREDLSFLNRRISDNENVDSTSASNGNRSSGTENQALAHSDPAWLQPEKRDSIHSQLLQDVDRVLANTAGDVTHTDDWDFSTWTLEGGSGPIKQPQQHPKHHSFNEFATNATRLSQELTNAIGWLKGAATATQQLQLLISGTQNSSLAIPISYNALQKTNDLAEAIPGYLYSLSAKAEFWKTNVDRQIETQLQRHARPEASKTEGCDKEAFM